MAIWCRREAVAERRGGAHEGDGRTSGTPRFAHSHSALNENMRELVQGVKYKRPENGREVMPIVNLIRLSIIQCREIGQFLLCPQDALGSQPRFCIGEWTGFP